MRFNRLRHRRGERLGRVGRERLVIRHHHLIRAVREEVLREALHVRPDHQRGKLHTKLISQFASFAQKLVSHRMQGAEPFFGENHHAFVLSHVHSAPLKSDDVREAWS